MATHAQELVLLLEHSKLTTYIDFASLALLVYEYALTIETERSLIWTMPWSIAKLLFIATRYLPFIDTTIVLWHQLGIAMTNGHCQFAYKVTGWLQLCGILIAEIILVLRAWAIWERRRIVGVLLLIWTVAIWLPEIIFMAKFLSTLKFSPLPDGIAGCLVVGGSSVLTVNWILLMVFEAGRGLQLRACILPVIDIEHAGVLCFMLVVGFRTYKIHGNSAMFKAVYGDGSLFYFYLFALSVANVVVIQTLPADFLNTLTSLERVLHSVLACRILTNLRRVGRNTVIQSGISTGQHELATLSLDFRGREAFVRTTTSSNATYTDEM
ncbi:hypothetical protein ACEPAH_4007 [Sanghuangporus vaninii]